MKPDAIHLAAQTLAKLRRERKLIDALEAGQRPATLAEGYAIQDQVVAIYGDHVAGWKIGATAKPIMEKFGVTEPFTGPVFASDVLASPAEVTAAAHPHLIIEAEFAFRLASPLMPREAPYTRADVVAAVATVMPAFEIVSPRFTSLMFDDVASVVADGSLNGAFVLGPETADWRGLELPGHAVSVSVNGRPAGTGSGANVMGDPVAVLAWTANHFRERRVVLEAGQFVSTGATTGLHFLEVGQVIRADFGTLGSVEMSFAGPAATDAVRGV